MRNFILAFGLIFLPTIVMGSPCVNVAHSPSLQVSDMLTCELTFSSLENNRKYTLAALEIAEEKACIPLSGKAMMTCFNKYKQARSLLKERVGLAVLKKYSKAADSFYPRPLRPCPKSASKALCESVDWPQEGSCGGWLLVLLLSLVSRIGFATPTPTEIETPMGSFVVEVELGLHKCSFVPAKKVPYNPQRKKAVQQMFLWDEAEQLCLTFNKIDQLTRKLLPTGANLNYREQAAIEVLLGWKDRTSLVAHEYGLRSRLEKIGRRFKRLQR